MLVTSTPGDTVTIHTSVDVALALRQALHELACDCHAYEVLRDALDEWVSEIDHYVPVGTTGASPRFRRNL